MPFDATEPPIRVTIRCTGVLPIPGTFVSVALVRIMGDYLGRRMGESTPDAISAA